MGIFESCNPVVSLHVKPRLLALSTFFVRKSARRFTAFRHAALGSWTIQSRSNWQRWWLCFGSETCFYPGVVANFEQPSQICWSEQNFRFWWICCARFVDIVLSNVPGHLEDDDKISFLRSILQPLRGRVQNVFSKLKSVKIHKSPGHVEWRGIHSTVNTPLTGAIRFIVYLLRPVLSSLEHLLKNSEALVKKLALLRVSSGSRFLKIDIKKYFMEGLHSQFVQYSAEFVEMKWRPFYEAVLQHILETQFIEVESLDGRLWKALKGSDILVILGGTHTSRVSFSNPCGSEATVWKLEAESVDEFSYLFWIWLLQKVGDGNPLVCFMLGFTINPPVCTNRWRHTRHIGCNTRFLLEVLHLKRRLAARFGTLCRPYPKQPPSLASQEYLTSRLIIQHGNCHFSDRFCGKCQVRTMLPWCDSIRIQVSYALAAPHLHVRLAKLRCDGNGGDYIGWHEGIEEE